MRIAAVVLALVLSGGLLADLAVAVWPLDRAFAMPDAVMLDDLLGRLARDDSAAFLITSKSAYAPKLAALGPEAPGCAAMAQLAARCGLDDLILLQWSATGVRALSATGREAVVAAGALERDPKAAAMLLATVLAGASPSTTAPPGPTPPVPVEPPADGGPGAAVAPPTTGPSSPSVPPAQGGASVPPSEARPAEGAPLSGRPDEPSAPAVPTEPPGAIEPAPPAPAPPARAPTEAGKLWYERAVQSYREGNYTLALDRLEKALQAGASRADVLEMRARILAALGDAARQRRALDELVQIDPSRTKAVISLSILLEEEGLWQEAVRVLKNGLAARPDDPQLYDRLAAVYRRQRRSMEALETLRRGLEATDDKNLALLLAAAQEASGDWRGAMALYTKLATDENPDIRARALDAVGDAYARRGLVDQAVEAYIEAARSRGVAAILSPDRYRAVYSAADALVRASVSSGWQGFEALATGKQTVSRETALAALSAASGQLGRALALCDDALPPPELQAEHRSRQLYYSLLREAVVAALTYVDTGRADMIDIASDRMRQALAEDPAGDQP